jgi:hypothetical protein
VPSETKMASSLLMRADSRRLRIETSRRVSCSARSGPVERQRPSLPGLPRACCKPERERYFRRAPESLQIQSINE